MNKLFNKLSQSTDVQDVEGTMVFDSGESGPSVGLMCLTHGNELAGIKAIEKVIPDLLGITRGRVIVTCNNILATTQGKRFVEQDMNRVFSPEMINNDSPDAARARELLKVFDEMDIALDLHTVTSTPDAAPFTIIPGGTQAQIDLAKQLDVDYQVLYPKYINGTGSTSDYFVENDKACITIELGYEYTSDIDAGLRNIRRYLAYAGVLEYEDEFEDTAKWLEVGQMEWVSDPETIAYQDTFERRGFAPVTQGQFIAIDMTQNYRVNEDGYLLFSKDVAKYASNELSIREPFIYLAREMSVPK